MHLTTNQDITITTDYRTVQLPTTPIFDGNDAEEAKIDTIYTLTDTQIYKIHLDLLRGKRVMPEVTVTNNGTSDATVTAKIGMTATPTSVIEKTVILGVGQSMLKDIEKNMIDGISTPDGDVYVQIITTQPIAFSARLKHVNEGNACKNSVNFNWTTGHTQEANTTVWYAVSIAEAKTNVQDILLSVENLSGATATMTVDVAFACPYIDLQSVTRTLAAGDSLTQTIGYSLFGMLTTDEVYVGLTTNQRVKITATTKAVVKNEPDDACLRAKVFDMTEGGKQSAGDTVWYKVGMNSLYMIDQLPYVSIQNRGTAPVTIHGELSLDCPDSIPNTTRNLTIGVGGTYEKLISRDLFDNIDYSNYDTVYVMLTANQAFAFQVQLKEENLGATCKSAIRFNWTSGNDQNADTDLWYLVDLTAAKAGKKDIQLSIINKDNAAATISAAFAFDCPCEVPQTESTQLGALAYKTTTLPYSSLETAGDTVWVRLSTDRTIHFEAELVAPAHFDTIQCPENVETFAWDTTYLEAGGTDTAWYYLNAEVLRAISNSVDSTPRLTLRNTSGTANTIRANITYHCPITSQMISKAITLGNGQEVYKLLERSFAEQVAGRDTVMVQLIATGAYEFLAELVNPNTGEDCLHAQLVNLPDTLIQEAGTTAWYKLDVATVANLNSKITFGIRNTDNTAGALHAAIHTACDSAAMLERNTTLGAGKQLAGEFTSDMFRGLGTPYVYLQVTTAQQIQVFGYISPLDTLIPNITACEAAIPVAPNTDYILNADSTAWYVVNMQDLRANTKGDGTLTIKNQSETDKLTAKAECSWTCPVVYQMTDITRSIAAGGQYTQTLARSSIDATSDSLLYVRVSGNQDLSFRLDISYSKGETCDNPIEFDWVNGNIHSAGTPLWYRVALDSAKVPEGKDLLLFIENLVDTANGAGASLYMECGSTPMASKDYTLTVFETKDITIDRQLLEGTGWTDLFICYNSNKNSKIYTDFKEHEERRDTTYVRICEGDPWTSPIDSSERYFYAPTSESANLSAPLIWSDTVRVRGSLNCDSIYTFIVTPLHLPAPFQLTADTLVKYNAVPVLKQGMEVFTDSSWLNIQRYLALNDSVVLDTAHCKWQVPTSIIAKGTDSISLTLHLVDSCEAIVDYNYKFPVAPYRVDSIELPSTHCAGETFVTPRLGITYSLAQDTILRDTVACTATDTLGLTLHYDSVYIYRLTVQAPTYATVETQTICAGDTYTWRGRVLSADSTYRDTAFYTNGCDSIYYELHLTVQAPIDTIVKADTICYGDTYTWRGRVLSADSTYRDTAFYTSGCDSIYYELHLTVQAPVDTLVQTQSIPAGTTFTWRDLELSETDTYRDTAFYTNTGCDSIYYELHLTVEEPITRETTITDTVCVGTEWQSRTQTIVITQDTIWNEQVLFKDAVNGDIDSTYHYNIHVFRTTTPYIDPDSILAVCGKAVDVTAADNFLTAAIENEPLYAPNAKVTWEQLVNDLWSPISTDALAGNISEITLRYFITTDCGIHASDLITVSVQIPDPTNTEEMKDLPALSKYNNYLLMINLNAIQDNLGWTLKEEDVTWYKVVGEADPTHPDDMEKDTQVGTGFYYTTGEQLVGNYYALIEHEKVEASDCEQHAISTLLVCANSGAAAPALQPTMVNPGQDIYILPLNPLTQTEIRVYDVEGNLLHTYTSTEAEQFLIRAASQQGFYMVDVQTDEQKTTLRYIVK